MTYVSFAGCAIAAAALFTLGLRKLVAPRAAAREIWVPGSAPDALPGVLAVLAGSVEALVALLALVPLAPRPLTAAVVAGLGAVLSAYGLVALAKTGACGCGRIGPRAVSTPRALLLRNAALFGMLLQGIALGPSWEHLRSDAGGYVLALLGIAYLALAAVIAARVWSRAPRAPRAAAAAAGTVAAFLALVAVATAAMHTTNSVYHGLSSSNGGGLGSGLPVAAASAQTTPTKLWASMYHLRDDGGWNLQCEASPAYGLASCTASQGWGSHPCRKYAYTQGVHDSFGKVLAWHGMNGASC